jgi:hypothetical protein
MNFLKLLYGIFLSLTTSTGPLEHVCKELIKTNEVWNLVSRNDKTMKVLNVAFPDFATDYWFSCFSGNQRPLFIGKFPDWAYYSALTSYDTYANEIQGASVESKYHIERGVPIDLFENVTVPTSTYIVIFRIYSPYNATDDSYRRINTEVVDERFRVETNNVFFKATDLTTAISNTIRLEGYFEKIITYITPRVKRELYEKQFKCMSGDSKSLFTNANAIYLVAFTKKHYFKNNLPVVRLDGLCQPPNEYLYYYDIMAVNQDTTETDDSISFEKLGTKGLCTENEPYVVIISKTWDPEYSKIKNLNFIQWDYNNTFPAIVIRYLIDLKTEKGQEFANVLKTIDGESYENKAGVPEIRYLRN